MALARARRDSGMNYWPGFVDALSTLVLGDPRLGVRLGFEHADRGRMTVRDADLDTE